MLPSVRSLSEGGSGGGGGGGLGGGRWDTGLQMTGSGLTIARLGESCGACSGDVSNNIEHIVGYFLFKKMLLKSQHNKKMKN